MTIVVTGPQLVQNAQGLALALSFLEDNASAGPFTIFGVSSTVNGVGQSVVGVQFPSPGVQPIVTWDPAFAALSAITFRTNPTTGQVIAVCDILLQRATAYPANAVVTFTFVIWADFDGSYSIGPYSFTASNPPSPAPSTGAGFHDDGFKTVRLNVPHGTLAHQVQLQIAGTARWRFRRANLLFRARSFRGR